MKLPIRHLEPRVRIPEFMAPRVFGTSFFNTQKQLQFFITIHLNVMLIVGSALCCLLLLFNCYNSVLINGSYRKHRRVRL